MTLSSHEPTTGHIDCDRIITNLRKALHGVAADWKDANQRAYDAEAEVRRLRGALETINGLCERHEGAEWQSLTALVRNVARAAQLAEKEKGGHA